MSGRRDSGIARRSRTSSGALEKEKLDVLNVVNVEEGKIELGLSAAVTITLDVRPEITVPDYVGLPTEVAPTDATDTDDDPTAVSLRTRLATAKARLKS